MLQRHRRRHSRHLLSTPAPKRTATGRQYHPANFSATTTLQTLKNRTVLAVHRNDLSTRFTGTLHQQTTSHHQRLLVRQRHTLARIHRCPRRRQPRCPHHRTHDRPRLRMTDQLVQYRKTSITSNPRRNRRQSHLITAQNHPFRTKLRGLLTQKLPVLPRRQSRHAQPATKMPDYVQTTGANRAGRTQQCHSTRRTQAVRLSLAIDCLSARNQTQCNHCPPKWETRILSSTHSPGIAPPAVSATIHPAPRN